MEMTYSSRGLTGALLERFRIDFRPSGHPPAAIRWVAATVVAIAGSLALDALLVLAGTHVFPATSGYVHFRFGDYASLTVIGVVIGCLAWPVTTQISSAARWVFLRMAVAVSAVLLLPDCHLLVQGQPPKAVAVLACMHLAIGLVTYNTVVRMAPARVPRRRRLVDTTARAAFRT